jgi:putative transcriptional regulator
MAKRNLFEELKRGLEDIRDRPDTLKRYKFKAIDIKSVRKQFEMSQSEMAMFLGISVDTLQNWEQGRRTPQGAAQTLLRVMQNEPTAVMRALHP